MNAKLIVESLKSRKGQHVVATWKRERKTPKGSSDIVEKRTTAFIRAGIDYANLASVKSGIEAGERGEVEALPWGEWSEFPFTITHKGADYVRFYPATFANLKPVVTYFVNHLEATEAQAKALCLASEFRERDEAPSCFTLKADNVIAIN